MPPFPTGNSITQLLLEQGQRRAQLAQQLGQIAAETQARNGQIWGNTLAQLGQLPTEILQQRAADQELKLRQQQMQLQTQRLQDEQAQRNQGTVNQAAIGSFMQAIGKQNDDGTYSIDPGQMAAKMAEIGTPPALQAQTLKQIDVINSSNAALRTAKLQHARAQAQSLLGLPDDQLTPDAIDLVLQANVMAGTTTPQEAQQMSALVRQSGGRVRPILESIANYGETAEARAKAATAEAEAKIKGRQAAGMSPEGLLPKEQADLAAQQARLQQETANQQANASRMAASAAETARHNRVMEGQGAQRIGLTATGQADPGQVPAALNPNAPHGDDYLKTLPANAAAMVKSLAEGRQPWPSSFALRTPYWQSLVQQVMQYDPTFDTAQASNNARTKVRADFTSGKSAQQVNAINTVVGHLSELSDKADALGNSPVQFINSVKNWVKTQAGAPEVTNFNTAKKAVADELTRVWRQAGGAESDIKSWQTSLDAANSPAQLHEAFKTIGGLLESKLNALQSQYQQGMGTSDIQMINPASRRSLDKLERRAGSSSETGGYIYARDPQGVLHRAPAGTALPAGWVKQ